jgi:hypothetical protein
MNSHSNDWIDKVLNFIIRWGLLGLLAIVLLISYLVKQVIDLK